MTLDPKALEAAQEAFRWSFGKQAYIRVREVVYEYLRAREAQGFVEVPVEPTQEMLNAGVIARRSVRLGGAGVQSTDATSAREYAFELAVYPAMLAARPQKETDQ